jgi:hypothetical protein
MKSADKPATAAKPAPNKSADRPGLAAAQSEPEHQKKSVDKPGLGHGKPMTKQVEIAKTDPLAPLPAKRPHKDSPTGR